MENRITFTLELTEREVRMLYRACMGRAYHFVEKAGETEDPWMRGIDMGVANHFRELGKSIITQTSVNR